MLSLEWPSEGGAVITCIKQTSTLSGKAVLLEGDVVWVCARSERLGLQGSDGTDLPHAE